MTPSSLFTAFLSVPVIVHLHRRQGVTTLWKGIGSSLLVRGISLAVEDVNTEQLQTFQTVLLRNLCFLGLIKVHAVAKGNQFENDRQGVHTPLNIKIDFFGNRYAILFSITGGDGPV